MLQPLASGLAWRTRWLGMWCAWHADSVDSATGGGRKLFSVYGAPRGSRMRVLDVVEPGQLIFNPSTHSCIFFVWNRFFFFVEYGSHFKYITFDVLRSSTIFFFFPAYTCSKFEVAQQVIKASLSRAINVPVTCNKACRVVSHWILPMLVYFSHIDWQAFWLAACRCLTDNCCVFMQRALQEIPYFACDV